MSVGKEASVDFERVAGRVISQRITYCDLCYFWQS